MKSIASNALLAGFFLGLLPQTGVAGNVMAQVRDSQLWEMGDPKFLDS
jgi:hypothetical protein